MCERTEPVSAPLRAASPKAPAAKLVPAAATGRMLDPDEAAKLLRKIAHQISKLVLQ